MTLVPKRVLIRRHEKTTKNAEGKKLDQPTPEGVANAYQSGMALREEFGDQLRLKAYHSNKKRTAITAANWLMGAGIVPVSGAGEADINMTHHQALNSFSDAMPRDVYDLMRNMTDKEAQLRAFFDLYGSVLNRSGASIAQLAASQLEMVSEFGIPRVALGVTHGPSIDAGLLAVLGAPVTYDSMMQKTGIIKEGEGWEVTFDRVSGIYHAKVSLNGDPLATLSLDNLSENIKAAYTKANE